MESSKFLVWEELKEVQLHQRSSSSTSSIGKKLTLLSLTMLIGLNFEVAKNDTHSKESSEIQYVQFN